MSSILRALRKLEDDKSALGEGNVDIAHDILKRRYENLPATKNRLLIGLIALLFVVVLVVFWLFWPHEPLQIGKVAPVPVETTTTPPMDKGSASAAAPRQAPESPALSPILSQPLAGLAKPQQPKTAVVRPEPGLQVDSGPVKAHSVPAVVLPELLVTEIIDNRHPEARLAIVNDLPVMEATEIAGAQVIEILPDRVRFSYQGVEFFKSVQK